MTTTDNLRVTRLAGALGAEVHGFSLAKLNDSDVARIEDLLTENLVLFFPDQYPTADEHLTFGRHFGPLEGHPNLNRGNLAEHPEIFELSTIEGRGGVADEWHSDLTCEAEPALISILHMVQCPAVGGDTMWANQYLAFEGLSPPLRELCEGLTALHDAHPHNRSDKMAVHPVVRVHSQTGRKSLFVNEHFTRRIVEMSAAESDMLLGYLTRWVTSPSFTVRYHWSEGTVAMWDNRCTQHFVLSDFEEDRTVQRVTVMGDKPVGDPPRWEPFIRLRGVRPSQHDRQLCDFFSNQDGSN